MEVCKYPIRGKACFANPGGADPAAREGEVEERPERGGGMDVTTVGSFVLPPVRWLSLQLCLCHYTGLDA